jgi:hypothetical protein
VERLAGLCILKLLIISLLNLQNTSLPCQNSAVSKEHVDNHPLDSPCRSPHPRACYIPTLTHAPHRLPCFPANAKLCKLLSTRVQQVAYLPHLCARSSSLPNALAHACQISPPPPRGPDVFFQAGVDFKPLEIKTRWWAYLYPHFP